VPTPAMPARIASIASTAPKKAESAAFVSDKENPVHEALALSLMSLLLPV